MDKTLKYLLVLVNVLGIAYILGIGIYSHVAHDDYVFLNYLHTYGFAGSIKHWYVSWQGRFTAQFITNAILSLHKAGAPLLLYYVVLFGLGVYSIALFIKNVFNYTVSERLSLFYLLTASIFVFILSVYNSFQFNTFFWVNASVIYIGGVVVFLCGFGELLNPKTNWGSYFIVGLSFLYVGASSENFSFITILLLSIFLLSVFVEHKQNLKVCFKTAAFQKGVFAVSITVVAFLLMVKAPGTAVRLRYLSWLGYAAAVPVPIAQLPFETLGEYLWLLLKVVGKLPLLLMSLPLFIFFGEKLNGITRQNSFTKPLAGTLAFIALNYLFILPNVYAQAYIGPDRALSYMSFFLSLLFFFWGVVIGKRRVVATKVLHPLVLVSLTFFCFAFIRDIYLQVPELKKYSLSEKKRLSDLTKAGTQYSGDLLVVDSLYTPYFISYSDRFSKELVYRMQKLGLISRIYPEAKYAPLFYSELSTDTLNFVNINVRENLHLPFAIQVKQ